MVVVTVTIVTIPMTHDTTLVVKVTVITVTPETRWWLLLLL